MLKLFTKKWLFSFFVSFLFTLFIGFFVWEIFINYDDGFVAKLFTASLFSPKETTIQENIEQNQVLEQELELEQPDKNLSEEEYFDGPVTISPQAISVEDQLDDIQEKLDIISQQIQELILEKNSIIQVEIIEEVIGELEEVPLELEDIQNVDSEEEKTSEEIVSCVGQININTALGDSLEEITDVGPVTAQKIIETRPFYSLNDLLKVSGIGELTFQKIIEQGCAYVEVNITPPPAGGGGGGPGLISYSKILISEVQISPIGERFVELYNPNSDDVVLTEWYLQRKTQTADSWSSFISSTNFEGKVIMAGGYFLISRDDPEGTPDADILLDITLSDGNSLVFKNPKGEVSDKLGFGLAQDFETSSTNNPEDSKSIGRKFINTTEQDTDDNLSDFELQTPTPRAQNITFIEPPLTDTTPPEVTFNLDSVQDEIDFVVDFTIIDIDDTVTPSGLESYIFRWQEGGGDWQEDSLQEILGAPLSIDLIKNVSGSDGQVFNFQAKATDVAGNTSEWLPTTSATTTISIPVVTKNILINEIQIAGVTVKDEFIELYNPNNFDVDISGFSLKKKTSGGTESNLVSSGSFSGIITALGYFLIAPQDDEDGTLNYTGLAIPDLRYSGKSYSIASNNTVLLYDKSDNLQDKVGLGSAEDFETLSAPNPDDSKSVTRTSGIDTDNNSADFIILDIPTPKG